jgi:hypothetical protein
MVRRLALISLLVSLASSQDGSMTGGCPTACAITSREGEAGYPVAVVWLPGRRAGLEVVEKLLTSIEVWLCAGSAAA